MFRVRVSWGRLENFKCVDYFQIEYYEKSNMAATVKENYGRHGTVLFAPLNFLLAANPFQTSSATCKVPVLST
jgi:hypothetical protein